MDQRDLNVNIIGDQSSFCARCRPLCLDPSQYRWRERTDPTGASFLESTPIIDQDPYERTQNIPFILHDSLPQLPRLEETASSGCAFCTLLRAAVLSKLSHITPDYADSSSSVDARSHCHLEFSEAKYEWISAKSVHWGENAKYWYLKSLSLYGTCTTVNEHASSKKFNICFDVISPPSKSSVGGAAIAAELSESVHEGAPLAIYQRPLVSSILSDTNLNMVRSWLRYCNAGHTLCASPSCAILPTRLVEIDTVGTSCRLKLMNEPGDQYVALSYTWGTFQPPLRLTMQSLDAFRNNIPFALMPRAFQDVLRFVQALGFRHVWIDSLCIIQDNEEDWSSEVSKMMEIYQNAALTISLSGSRTPHQNIRSELEIRNAITMSYTSLFNSQVPGHYLLSPSPSVNTFQGPSLQFFHDVDPSYWNTRGWTFHEKLLSRRTLYFGTRKMYFTCQESLFMEGSDVCEEPNRLTYPSLAIHWFWYRINKTRNPDSLLENWLTMAQAYSTRNLSYISDKLPALSALAKEMQQRLVDNCDLTTRYLCGIWDTDLIRGLAWYPVSANTSETDQLSSQLIVKRDDLPLSLPGPSWAWTSYDTPVRFAHLNLLSHSIESDTKLRLTSSNTKEHISDASSSPMACISLQVSSQIVPLNFSYLVDSTGNAMQISSENNTVEFSLNWTTSDYDAATNNQLDVYALAIQFHHVERSFSKPYISVGLLVTPAGLGPNGVKQYRRIGLVFCNSERKSSVFDGVEAETVLLV
ncbi:HET-domain-containing protein [Pseudovirgaria hyperparasitica]|uniref:HET-domain-containing protein n=1 Tax=Pseudovirgaria hyperparasitica TaxID=470096 RepID=A0A6A6W3F1_9PEZI|nr:HET-domain-containing protein [Pseudovirgaria hyperparasitica]KAF2756506.1 HET-domain-containing protein [Pseudovirgaria hyperparasitica]